MPKLRALSIPLTNLAGCHAFINVTSINLLRVCHARRWQLHRKLDVEACNEASCGRVSDHRGGFHRGFLQQRGAAACSRCPTDLGKLQPESGSGCDCEQRCRCQQVSVLASAGSTGFNFCKRCRLQSCLDLVSDMQLLLDTQLCICFIPRFTYVHLRASFKDFLGKMWIGASVAFVSSIQHMCSSL